MKLTHFIKKKLTCLAATSCLVVNESPVILYSPWHGVSANSPYILNRKSTPQISSPCLGSGMQMERTGSEWALWAWRWPTCEHLPPSQSSFPKSFCLFSTHRSLQNGWPSRACQRGLRREARSAGWWRWQPPTSSSWVALWSWWTLGPRRWVAGWDRGFPGWLHGAGGHRDPEGGQRAGWGALLRGWQDSAGPHKFWRLCCR